MLAIQRDRTLANFVFYAKLVSRPLCTKFNGMPRLKNGNAIFAWRNKHEH